MSLTCCPEPQAYRYAKAKAVQSPFFSRVLISRSIVSKLCSNTWGGRSCLRCKASTTSRPVQVNSESPIRRFASVFIGVRANIEAYAAATYFLVLYLSAENHYSPLKKRCSLPEIKLLVLAIPTIDDSVADMVDSNETRGGFRVSCARYRYQVAYVEANVDSTRFPGQTTVKGTPASCAACRTSVLAFNAGTCICTSCVL